MKSTSTFKNKRKIVEIKEQAKGKERWIFTNTKCQVDRKVSFRWNHLLQDFKTREFQVLLQDDPIIEMNK